VKNFGPRRGSGPSAPLTNVLNNAHSFFKENLKYNKKENGKGKG